MITGAGELSSPRMLRRLRCRLRLGNTAVYYMHSSGCKLPEGWGQSVGFSKQRQGCRSVSGVCNQAQETQGSKWGAGCWVQCNSNRGGCSYGACPSGPLNGERQGGWEN